MAKSERRDASKEAFWRGMVQQHAASRQSVRAFCRERRLSEASFYAWRRELALRDDPRRARQAPAFVLATLQPAAATALQPASVAGATTQGCAIELRGGRVLRLPAAYSAQQVAALAAAFETFDAAQERQA